MPIADAVRWLAENGEPADPRTDIDTASLKRRFPHLAAVETADIRIDGPHGRLVPARLYRDAAAPASGRALVWVHGGAFIGGYLDMPEANWVALELAARGIPVLSVDYVKCLGDVHFPEPTDEVRTAWEHARAHAEELFGVDADALLLGGASAGGNLTAGAVAQLQDAGEPVPAGLVLVYPAVHPNGPEASAEVDLASPHGQLAMNFAGSERLCATRTRSPRSGGSTGSRRRSSSSARRTTCVPRAKRSRVSSRMPASRWTCTWSLVPATVTSTSRPIRRRFRRSRRSPNGSAHESARPPTWSEPAVRGAVEVEVSPTGLTPVAAAAERQGAVRLRLDADRRASRPRVCAASSGRRPRGSS